MNNSFRVGCSKFAKMFCMIYDRIYQEVLRASLTPLGRVFKIHKKNLHEIGKVLVCLKQLIFNIKNSKTAV